MKSRMAITMMLVLGLLLSTAGAGLAIQGGSESGSAANAQYPPNTPPQVLGQEDSSGTAPSANTGTTPRHRSTTPCRENGTYGSNGSGVAGANGSGNSNGTGNGNAACAQAPRQLAAQGTSSGQLPFTGFAAIPVLIGGLVLLTAGLMLRRRTAGDAR